MTILHRAVDLDFDTSYLPDRISRPHLATGDENYPESLLVAWTIRWPTLGSKSPIAGILLLLTVAFLARNRFPCFLGQYLD